jgi:hypothetical protein
VRKRVIPDASAAVVHGYVFTRKDGEPINPSFATTRFRILTDRAGLPPVRFHDPRHGATSLAHEASADLMALQDPCSGLPASW